MIERLGEYIDWEERVRVIEGINVYGIERRCVGVWVLRCVDRNRRSCFNRFNNFRVVGDLM